MIQHDLGWTLHQMPGYQASVVALAAENRRLRADLADILMTGDRATRGARLVEVHGQAVVIVGAEEWQAMRRAQVAASNHLVNTREATN